MAEQFTSEIAQQVVLVLCMSNSAVKSAVNPLNTGITAYSIIIYYASAVDNVTATPSLQVCRLHTHAADYLGSKVNIYILQAHS